MVSLAGFGLSAAINGGIALLVLSLFLWLRRKPINRFVYAPRLLHEANRQGRPAPPTLPDHWFSWLYTLVFDITNQDVLQSCGLDAYMFLRYLELCVKLFALMTVFGVGILVPVSYTIDNGVATDPFDTISLANIDVHDDARLSAFVVVAYLSSVSAYALIFLLYRDYHHRRMAFLTQEHLQNRRLTLIITNIPPAITSDELLAQTWTTLHPRSSALSRVLHPQELIKDVSKHVSKRTLQLLSNLHVLELLQLSHLHPHRAAQDADAKKRQLLQTSVDHTQAIHSAHLIKNVGPLNSWVIERDECLASLESALIDYQLNPKERPTVATRLLCFSKRDAIEHFTSKLEELNEKIVARKALFQQMKCFSNGFVTYDSVVAMQRAMALEGDSQLGKLFAWKVEMAPELRDVRWSALSFSAPERYTREVLVTVVLFFLIFFWLIPITIIQGIANLEVLSSTYSSLHFLQDIPAGTLAIIDGVLPGLILTIFNILLPLILYKLARIQGVFAYSQLSEHVLTTFFVFQVIANFIGSQAVTAIAKDPGTLFSNPSEITTILSSTIPATSTFFITFLLLSTFSVYPLMLLNPAALIIGHIKKRFLVKTARDFVGVEAAQPLDYGKNYPVSLFVFIIASCFLLLASIILPFAVLYFSIAWFANKYMLLYVYNNPFENGGKFWPCVMRKMMYCIVISQIIFTLVLGLKQAPGPAAASAPLIFLPIAFTVLMEYLYRWPSDALPLQLALAVDEERQRLRAMQDLKDKEQAKTASEPCEWEQRETEHVFLDESNQVQRVPYDDVMYKCMTQRDMQFPHNVVTAYTCERFRQQQCVLKQKGQPCDESDETAIAAVAAVLSGKKKNAQSPTVSHASQASDAAVEEKAIVTMEEAKGEAVIEETTTTQDGSSRLELTCKYPLVQEALVQSAQHLSACAPSFDYVQRCLLAPDRLLYPTTSVRAIAKPVETNLLEDRSILDALWAKNWEDSTISQANSVAEHVSVASDSLVHPQVPPNHLSIAIPSSSSAEPSRIAIDSQRVEPVFFHDETKEESGS